MKIVQVPAEKEEALYFSDFTGKPLNPCGSDITLTIDFGFGSENDGRFITLHLDDSDIKEVLALLAKKTNSESVLDFLTKYHNI